MGISCIRMDCILTDPFGLSATRIMDCLLFVGNCRDTDQHRSCRIYPEASAYRKRDQGLER